MSVLAPTPCEVCGRTCYERGAVMIESAVISNGRPPFDVFIERLGDADRADVAVRFEDLARSGTLVIPRELRQLRSDGLWEIKTPNVRLMFFYETHPVDSRRTIRITHGFMKGVWRTSNGRVPRKEFNKADWIHREDLAA